MHHPRRRAALPASFLTLVLMIGACGGDTAPDTSPDSGNTGDIEGATPGDEAPDGAAEDDSTEDAEPDAEDADPDAESAPEDGDAGEDTPGAGEDQGSPGTDAGDGGSGSELGDAAQLPPRCPDEVLDVGQRITGEFEHVEVPPGGEIAILTCDWRDSGNSIASVEVSFSRKLFGTDLAEFDGAERVTVAGVDGYFMDTGERDVKTNMFQFHTEGVYITGGSIEVGDVGQGDVLELAEAAIEAVTS